MSADKLVSLIESKLQEWAELEDLAIAFEGVGFKPPADIYLKVKHFPALTVGAFLEGHHEALTGFWQVSIVCPKGTGTGPGRRRAMSLRDFLPQNLRLTDGDFSVQITTPLSLGPWIDDPEGAKTNRSTLPCSFQYRADTVS